MLPIRTLWPGNSPLGVRPDQLSLLHCHLPSCEGETRKAGAIPRSTRLLAPVRDFLADEAEAQYTLCLEARDTGLFDARLRS